MYMFLPFLLVLLTTILATFGQKRLALLLWLSSIGITLWWLQLRMSSPLDLSF